MARAWMLDSGLLWVKLTHLWCIISLVHHCFSVHLPLWDLMNVYATCCYETQSLTTNCEYLGSQMCFCSHAAVLVILVQVRRHGAVICKKPNDLMFCSCWEGC